MFTMNTTCLHRDFVKTYLLFSGVLFQLCYKTLVVSSQVVFKNSHFNLRQFHMNENKIPTCVQTFRVLPQHAETALCQHRLAQHSVHYSQPAHSDEHSFWYQGSSVRRHSGTTAQLIVFLVSIATRSTHRYDVIRPRYPWCFRFKHASVKYKKMPNCRII